MTPEDIDLIEQRAINQARVSFLAYRRLINPRLKFGWWTKEVSNELQLFADQLMAGECPYLVIEAPPQHGKLICDDTDVITASGWKRHGDLVVGDRVRHPSGHFINVVALSEKGSADWRVSFGNGDSIWCHGNHEWTVYNRNTKRTETIETRKMIEQGTRSVAGRNPLYTGTTGSCGCHYTFKLPPVDPFYGDDIDLPLDPYVLGAWLGDGTQTKPAMSYAKNDVAIINHMESCGYPVVSTWVHSKTGVVTADFGMKLRRHLRDAGVFSESYGVRNKHIPVVYMGASLRQRLELLAGLIDTDGYCYQKNGRVVFTTSDSNLADTFCHLISTFGWRFSHVIEQPKISSSGIVGVKQYSVIGFNPTLVIPCKLMRKRNNVLALKRRVPIVAIDYMPSGKIGRCIQVDAEDGLYLVGKTMQPTHNSILVVEFVSWLAGRYPDAKTIYTSFSERLGIRANLRLQRIYDSAIYKKIFTTRINDSGNVSTSGKFLRNREMLEYVDTEGYFRNTTVRGSITGESLDLGIIDDPIKGREEAGSEAIRNKTWDWLTDDFFTRFSESAGLLCILTRWHIDDPIGRLKARMGDKIKVLSYPATAVHDEKNRKTGDALFPEHKSLRFLLERKATMAASSWESLYQQNPQIIGGEIIKGEYFRYYSKLPVIVFRGIYVDTAMKTGERNDYSVFECWGKGDDGRIYLIDLMRGKWEAPELERRAISFWTKHKAQDDQYPFAALRYMKVEDKASGTGLIQTIRNRGGIPIIGIPRSIDKMTRVNDVLGYIEAGLVALPEQAEFTSDFVSECEAFTADDSHLFDDQIDPMLDALVDMMGIQADDLSGFATGQTMASARDY